MTDLKHTARVVPVASPRTSRYGHFFGGPPVHHGAKFRHSKVPLHLVYCFNLSDPVLAPVRKRMRRVRWLPLYYGFRFDGCRFGYRVAPGGEITVYEFGRKHRLVPDFPYEGYPPAFPKVAVRLERLGYEQQKVLLMADRLSEDGDFRLGSMSAEDRKLVRSWGYPVTQVGGFHRLIQGRPLTPCPNRSCPSYGWPWGMDVFATVWNSPAAGVTFWGKDDEGYIVLVYEQCGGCGTICVSNQCD